MVFTDIKSTTIQCILKQTTYTIYTTKETIRQKFSLPERITFSF